MALIKCPECGNQISDRAIRCPICGCPMKEQELKCPECGEIVSEHDLKCTNCGYPLNHKELDVNTLTNEPSHQDQEYTGSNINWLKVLAGAFCLYIGVFSFGSNGNIGDFAHKYAEKHGYLYSDVSCAIQVDFQLFPYPHQVYYLRMIDGSKKEVGSYGLWTYNVK